MNRRLAVRRSLSGVKLCSLAFDICYRTAMVVPVSGDADPARKSIPVSRGFV